MGRGSGRTEGAATPDARASGCGAGFLSVAIESLVSTRLGWEVDTGAETIRIVDGTSGLGSNLRTITSTSLFVRWRASVSTATWFSAVRTGLSIRTVVTFRDPSPSQS